MLLIHAFTKQGGHTMICVCPEVQMYYPKNASHAPARIHNLVPFELQKELKTPVQTKACFVINVRVLHLHLKVCALSAREKTMMTVILLDAAYVYKDKDVYYAIANLTGEDGGSGIACQPSPAQ